MPVALTIKTEGFKEAEKALAGIKSAYPTVAAQAINRALITGRKVVAQAIGARYNIKSGDVKNKITDHKATKSHLGGELELKGGMLPLTLFKPSGGRDDEGRQAEGYQGGDSQGPHQGFSQARSEYLAAKSWNAGKTTGFRSSLSSRLACHSWPGKPAWRQRLKRKWRAPRPNA